MNFDYDISLDEDFYKHVNNKWITESIIPDDNMIWNNFNVLQETNLKKTHDLLNKYIDTKNEEYVKIMILFKQLQDAKMNNMKTVNNCIKKIMDIDNIVSLRELLIDLFTLNGISNTNTFYVYNDFNDSTTNILHIGTGGLGLPDKEYYIDESKEDIRINYKKFIGDFLNYFNLEFNVDDIYDIEEKLSGPTYTNVQKRDCEIMNNNTTIQILEETNESLANDLKYFFKKINIISGKINITNPKFTKFYYELLNTTNLETLKNYFCYLFLRKMGNYIDNNTETLLFNFYGKVLSGIKKIKDPWKRTLDKLDCLVGMLVGKLFVSENFKKESKNKVIEMIQFIKLELKERLENNEWMENITKTKALEKLKHMNFKVGYPDKWKDFSSLHISNKDDIFTNVLKCYTFDYMEDIKHLYKDVDKTRWFMLPHEINAYYSPQYNEIVFPSGILQEPFYSIDQDIASNFGGIGTVIGHEITHGFDDMGRKFDARGNMIDWWTKNDSVKYKMKTLKLKEMFDKLKINDKNVNGELTLGENIADLGGVMISFNALKKYNLKFSDKLNNIQSYQLFFYNYANIWKCKITEEEIDKRLTTDPHSPPCYRVNIILSNMDDFYKYFDINNKSSMWINKEDRVNIW